MAQEFSNTAKQKMLDGLIVEYTTLYVSAHTATPGLTGANEVSGGSPAYARKALTYAAASGNSKATTGTVTLDIPTSTTVAWLGLWSAVTSGTFLGQVDISDEVFAAQGTLNVTAFTLSLDLDPA